MLTEEDKKDFREAVRVLNKGNKSLKLDVVERQIDLANKTKVFREAVKVLNKGNKSLKAKELIAADRIAIRMAEAKLYIGLWYGGRK